MTRKFDQHKIREVVAALRELDRVSQSINQDSHKPTVIARAADLIEDMAVVVYGIQERLPMTKDVTKGGS